ncbi:MAG: hypothetical protein OER86_00560 [Phycisphaerae bacterium]|nr:hypothetical protein [Phycisphaerae bacterium]
MVHQLRHIGVYLFVIAGCLGFVGASPLRADSESRRQERLEDLRDELADVEKRLGAARTEQQLFTEKTEQQKAAHEQASEEIRTLTESQAAARQKNTALQKQLLAMVKGLSEQANQGPGVQAAIAAEKKAAETHERIRGKAIVPVEATAEHRASVAALATERRKLADLESLGSEQKRVIEQRLVVIQKQGELDRQVETTLLKDPAYAQAKARLDRARTALGQARADASGALRRHPDRLRLETEVQEARRAAGEIVPKLAKARRAQAAARARYAALARAKSKVDKQVELQQRLRQGVLNELASVRADR